MNVPVIIGIAVIALVILALTHRSLVKRAVQAANAERSKIITDVITERNDLRKRVNVLTAKLNANNVEPRGTGIQPAVAVNVENSKTSS
ncbi:MAG: hypothetical protein KGI54_10335 [Pseudomonadota bacterium]|nr:hypothetical protein [Pseudomonadota bacterium]